MLLLALVISQTALKVASEACAMKKLRSNGYREDGDFIIGGILSNFLAETLTEYENFDQAPNPYLPNAW